MRRAIAISIVLATTGVTCFLLSPGRAETNGSQVPEIEKSAEVDERSNRDGRPDADSLALAARAYLTDAMKGTDPVLRLFALRASLRLHDPHLSEGARFAAGGADRYEQALALEILANSDPSGSREELLEALQSPFRGVRLRALRGLAALRDPALAERIGSILSADPDPDLRALAAQAVADTGAAQARLILHQALDDEVFAVRDQVVRALVRVRDDEISALMRMRLTETSPDRRVQNLRLIGLIPDASLVGDVGPFLADPDPEVRAFAASAILAILQQVKSAER